MRDLLFLGDWSVNVTWAPEVSRAGTGPGVPVLRFNGCEGTVQWLPVFAIPLKKKYVRLIATV